MKKSDKKWQTSIKEWQTFPKNVTIREKMWQISEKDSGKMKMYSKKKRRKKLLKKCNKTLKIGKKM